MTIPRPWLRAAWLALLLGSTWACSRQKGAEDAKAVEPGSSAKPATAMAPPWVGPYADEQKALLSAPLEAAVERRATPTYPDLQRFTFVGEGPIKVPDDLLGYADLVTRTLDDSSLTYVFRTSPDSIANVSALWGPNPAPVPDPWKRVELLGGQPSLVDALPSPELAEKLKLATQGHEADAIALLTEAAATPGAPPGVHAMLADAAIGAGDYATAERAAFAALQIDRRFPHAHRALAEVYLQRGDRDNARESLARCLAGYPPYDRAWQLGERLLNGPVHRPVDVPAPFIEVGPHGGVVVVSCERALCQGYAACKAAFRFEPVFRGSMLRESYAEPYHLSATEEVVCLEAGLGAHISAQEQSETAALPDPTAELLLRLAQERGLSSYAMFEILGQHRPEWLRVAPEPAYQAIVQYVSLHVLSPQPLRPLPGVPGGPPVTARHDESRPAAVGHEG